MRRKWLILGLLLMLPHCVPETGVPELPDVRARWSSFGDLRTEVMDPSTGEGDYAYTRPQLLDPTNEQGETGIYLEIFPEEILPYKELYKGIIVRIVNGGESPRPIATVDFMTHLFLQAQDEHGVWWMVDYADSGICTYSYFNVELEAKSYWELIMPRYEGCFNTQKRFVLLVGDGEVVYSEAFAGTIDPGLMRRRADEYLSKHEAYNYYTIPMPPQS